MAGFPGIPYVSQRRRDVGFLLALCVAEALLLWRSSAVFVDGDAFFYFANRITGASGILQALSAVDRARQYRPLGVLSVSFVFEPVFGLNHVWYSATALLAHVCNTVLVHTILERLLAERLLTRAATVFWALNPVAIYVTHSFSYLADFSYGFFYLLAIVAFLDHVRSPGRRSALLCVLAFMLSLLCKELAVTLPAVLLLLSLTALRCQPSQFDERAAQRLVRLLAVVVLAYLAFYASLKGGLFYDAGPTDNYYPHFNVGVLLDKTDDWLSVLLQPIPESHLEGAAAIWSRRLVYLEAPLCFLFLVFCVWPPAALAERVRTGLLWAVIGAAPVLFVKPVEFVHNLYLPAAGLALVVGLFWGHLTAVSRETRWIRPTQLHACGAALVLVSLIVNQGIFEDANWRPHWERVAKTWVDETRRLLPSLTPPPEIFVARTPESDAWNLYRGELLRVFYRQPALKVQFDDAGGSFPLEAARRGEAVALMMLDGHVHDITRFRLRESAFSGISLLNSFDRAKTSLLSGLPLDSAAYDTPGGKPAFLAPILAAGDYRNALTILGGTRVRFPVVVTANARLRFGINKRFPEGDGVVARIAFEGEAGRHQPYERRLNPRDVPGDRAWLDESVDLSEFAGQTGSLVLECLPGPANDYVADWLGWSDLRLEGAHLL